ncbi:MAG: hypothetical protein WCB61_06580 [Pseudolabrys sp.]
MFNQKPSAGNRRGFFVNRQQMKNARGQITKANLKALEGRLLSLVGRRATKDHRPLTPALVERSLALPQFAATKQKIIETIVQPLTRDTLSARGLMYSFDPKGFIEETIKTEGVIHLPRFGSSEPKLVDLTPKIKA